MTLHDASGDLDRFLHPERERRAQFKEALHEALAEDDPQESLRHIFQCQEHASIRLQDVVAAIGPEQTQQFLKALDNSTDEFEHSPRALPSLKAYFDSDAKADEFRVLMARQGFDNAGPDLLRRFHPGARPKRPDPGNLILTRVQNSDPVPSAQFSAPVHKRHVSDVMSAMVENLREGRPITAPRPVKNYLTGKYSYPRSTW